MDSSKNKPQNEGGQGNNSVLNVVYGTVTEALPNTLFRVQLENKDEVVMAYLAGKMRMHRIKVLIGDRVELILDSYGGRARISKRL